MFGLKRSKEDELVIQYRHSIDLMNEIAELRKENTMLRSESGIARDAIDRFCPPELREQAEIWIRRNGL